MQSGRHREGKKMLKSRLLQSAMETGPGFFAPMNAEHGLSSRYHSWRFPVSRLSHSFAWRKGFFDGSRGSVAIQYGCNSTRARYAPAKRPKRRSALILEGGLKAGLADAFMMHRENIAGFLWRRFSDGNDIEDIMHELWLRCHSVDASGVSDPKSYLYRIAHNLAIDRRRNALRGQRHEDAWDYMHSRAGGGAEPATAERTLLARERLAQIDQALNKLGDRAAWIFRRYRIDKIPQYEIASELCVSLSTVERDLRRAYKALVAVGEASNDE
jgi:RNA polymerase sigma factor (sigma-70 family)